MSANNPNTDENIHKEEIKSSEKSFTASGSGTGPSPFKPFTPSFKKNADNAEANEAVKIEAMQSQPEKKTCEALSQKQSSENITEPTGYSDKTTGKKVVEPEYTGEFRRQNKDPERKHAAPKSDEASEPIDPVLAEILRVKALKIKAGIICAGVIVAIFVVFSVIVFKKVIAEISDSMHRGRGSHIYQEYPTQTVKLPTQSVVPKESIKQVEAKSLPDADRAESLLKAIEDIKYLVNQRTHNLQPKEAIPILDRQIKATDDILKNYKDMSDDPLYKRLEKINKIRKSEREMY